MIADLWGILRRYSWLLLAAAILGGVLGYLRSAPKAPTYTASGQIQLPPGADASATGSLGRDGGPGGELIADLYLLESDRILAKVVSDLHLAARRDFIGFDPATQPSDAVRTKLQIFAVQQLRQTLRVVMVDGTNVARIESSNPDPMLAAAIVNTVIDDFVKDRYERRYAAAAGTSHFLAARLSDLRDQVNTTQRQLLILQEQLRTPGYDPRNSQIESSLETLKREVTRADLARISNGARLKMLQRDPAGTSPDQANSSSPSSRARVALDLARSDEAQLTEELGPSHPEVQAAGARLQALEGELAADYGRLVQGAATQASLSADIEGRLSAEFLRQQQSASGLTPQLAEYADLERQYVFARKLYFTYVERLRWFSADAALNQDAVYVVDRAMTPVPAPQPSRARRIAEYSLLATGLAGIAILFVTYARTGWPTVNRLERLTGLPALATIPQIAGNSLACFTSFLASGRLTGIEDTPMGAFVQGIFDLRQILQMAAESPAGKCILFTSAVPAEGKTTVSSSVAVAMARSGVRVLLIDADLHRPTLHRGFGLSARVGLTSVLAGNGTLSQAVQKVPKAPTLDVLTSGPLPPEPASLLGSSEMLDLLAEARQTYAVVLIDSPPLLSVTDGVLLARMVDKVVWVVRNGRSSARVLLRSRKLLQSSRVSIAGIVVNGVDVMAPKLSPNLVDRETTA